MREEDRELLGEVKAKIDSIHETVSILREDLRYLKSNQERDSVKLAKVEQSITNHLAHHDRNFRITMVLLGSFLSLALYVIKIL